MTEADALARARALLQEPTRGRPTAVAALALSVLMAVLAIGAAGAVVAGMVTTPAEAISRP